MQKSQLSIFYTDDDPDDQDLFREVIGEMSSAVSLHIQNNGEELLRQLDRDVPLPGLLFLDLNMPIKNGLEALKEIKKSVKLRDLPVIIFTTSSDSGAIERARELGANLFITKPSEFLLFKQAINYVLSLDWKTFRAIGNEFIYQGV